MQKRSFPLLEHFLQQLIIAINFGMDEPNDLSLPHCAKFSYKERYGCPWMGTPWHPKDSLIVLFKECAISTKKGVIQKGILIVLAKACKCSTDFGIYYGNVHYPTQH